MNFMEILAGTRATEPVDPELRRARSYARWTNVYARKRYRLCCYPDAAFAVTAVNLKEEQVMSIYLSDRELAQVQPAETAFRSPVPTQTISNGEFNPLPQTPQQRQVEARIMELADKWCQTGFGPAPIPEHELRHGGGFRGHQRRVWSHL